MSKTISIVRDFLNIPTTAMPSASASSSVLGSDLPASAVWEMLRNYMIADRRDYYSGSIVHLSADRDEWRDGITVTL